jgi:FkbM family methyltransferase
MFQQARRIIRHSSGSSRLKLLAAAASYSRPLLAGACSLLLRRLARDGRLEIEYRTYNQSRHIFLRTSQLRSDLYSALELAVGDCYRLHVLPKPELIIDGGGNTGLFTLAATSRWQQAKVIICEPVPDNLAVLEEHLKLNQIRAEVLPICLGAAAGHARFYCRAANEGSFSNELPYASEMEVRVRTLSDVYGGRGGRPTLIKLDIEGAEVDVLEEFLHLPRERMTIIGELHRARQQKPRLTDLLHRHRWQSHFFDESEHCSLFHLFSPDVAQGFPAGERETFGECLSSSARP